MSTNELITEARSYLSPKNGAYVQVPSADMFAAVVDALETAAIQLKRMEKVTAQRKELAEKHRRVEKFLRMERVAARELLVRAEEAEAGWHALTVVVERVKSVLVHPNRIEEHGEASLRWSIRKAFDILHECTSVVRNPGKSEAEQERDQLAAVVEQALGAYRDEGTLKAFNINPSVALARVKAEAWRDAADEVGKLDFGDDTIGSAGNWGAKAAADLLCDRADRIEKGESKPEGTK